MPIITRCRMLTIAVAAAACPLAPGWAYSGEKSAHWQGTALGAQARIYLTAPRARETLARCRIEIA